MAIFQQDCVHDSSCVPICLLNNQSTLAEFHWNKCLKGQRPDIKASEVTSHSHWLWNKPRIRICTCFLPWVSWIKFWFWLLLAVILGEILGPVWLLLWLKRTVDFTRMRKHRSFLGAKARKLLQAVLVKICFANLCSSQHGSVVLDLISYVVFAMIYFDFN